MEQLIPFMDFIIAILVCTLIVIIKSKYLSEKIINSFEFCSLKASKIENKLGAKVMYISLSLFFIINIYFFLEISSAIAIINLMLLILAYKWQNKIKDSETYNSTKLAIFIAFPLIYILYSIIPDEKFFGINKISLDDILRISGILFSLYFVYYLFNENWFLWILFFIHLISILSFHLSYIFEKHMGINGVEEIENLGGFENMWKINNKFERLIFHTLPTIAIFRNYIYSFFAGIIYLSKNDWKNIPRES